MIFLMMVMNYLDRQALSVVAPMMRRELGLSVIQYAHAVNAFLLAYSVMYAGSGMILDRVGYRAGLAFFVGLWTIFSGLHAATVGFSTLVIFRFLLGLAEPAGFTGAVKAIAENFSAAQRALATGILNLGSGLGSLIAPPLMVYLSLHYGWRTAFLVASALGILWVPLWMAATKRKTKSTAATAPRSLTPRQMLPLLRDRRVLAYVLTRFFGDSSGYFVLFWIPEYLVSSKHFSFLMLGTLGWIPPCGSDLGAILGALLSSRMVQKGRGPVASRKILMTAAAVLLAAGAAMQASSAVWVVLLSLSLCTLSVGMWACNLHALAADAFPRDIVATVHGTAGSAGAIYAMGFNLLVGYFSSRREYTVVLALFASLLPLAVTPLWLWLRDLDSTE
jgi:MFS transporter, ACS family, hexuronate transporter